MSDRKFDSAKADAFARYMLSILNGGMLSLMTSIGHETGLFDTMAGRAPSSCRDIAKAAGLHERYVREWLGAMVTGKIVVYDPRDRTYLLPPEHAASLTRAAGLKNVAKYTNYVSIFGTVEPQVAACFRHGGGVPYSEYPRFQKVQAEHSAAVYDEVLVQATLPAVPGLIERLQSGMDVADIGCGSGHAVNVMARAFPRSRFTGFDIAEDALRAARDEAARMQLANTRFEVRDAAHLGLRGQFDFITAFDTIHDQAHPAEVMREICEALRPGGLFLMQEMTASSHLEKNLDLDYGPYLYTASTLHCVPVSLADGGEGLGAGWGEELAREALVLAGFKEVDVVRTPGDPRHNNFVAVKASDTR